MPSPIVFFDIAGPDLEAQRRFYDRVFGLASTEFGQVSAPVAGPMLAGTLRQDPAEKMIYFGVDDVTATLDLIVESGGGIVAPRFEVPGVVVLGLFTDPAGNRLGLVELENGVAKIPVGASAV